MNKSGEAQRVFDNIAACNGAIVDVKLLPETSPKHTQRTELVYFCNMTVMAIQPSDYRLSENYYWTFYNSPVLQIERMVCAYTVGFICVNTLPYTILCLSTIIINI